MRRLTNQYTDELSSLNLAASAGMHCRRRRDRPRDYSTLLLLLSPMPNPLGPNQGLGFREGGENFQKQGAKHSISAAFQDDQQQFGLIAACGKNFLVLCIA